MHDGTATEIAKTGHVDFKPRHDKGLRAGDIVTVDTLGLGVVVRFSSITGEPHVYFYSDQAAICVGCETVERV